MILSKSWRYAVRALIYLAQKDSDTPILSTVIAKDESIPAPFLVKILGMLANARIVNSTRGPKGGFVLNENPEDITLMDIATATGYFKENDSCLLGYGRCSDGSPCSVHQFWEGPLEQITDFLEKTSLADLAFKLQDKEF